MDPATPYLRVDTTRLQANIDRTARWAAAAGVRLRPHVKTHKSPEIARLQLAAGAVGLTVATVGEAEVFVDHGATDVFVAYPLWLDQARSTRLRALADRASLSLGVDSVEAARNAGGWLAGSGIRVLVEVDSGQHRSGVLPSEAAGVATAAAEAGLEIEGVFTFPGHGYAPGLGASAGADEGAALAAATRAMAASGLPPRVVSGGSTPTLTATDTGVVTELRPGVYVFGDAQQWELGTIGPDRISLTCRTTVVSHAGGRVVVDAGSKMLGADRPPWVGGFGRLLEHPDARVVQLSEHHGVIEGLPCSLAPLGSRLDLVPNHVCSAVNLADTLFAEVQGRLEPWAVAARGRNS